MSTLTPAVPPASPPTLRGVVLATCWWHGPSAGLELQYNSVFRRELATLWDGLQAQGLVQAWRLEPTALYVAGYRVFSVLCVLSHSAAIDPVRDQLTAYPAAVDTALRFLYPVPDWVPADAPSRAFSVNAWPR